MLHNHVVLAILKYLPVDKVAFVELVSSNDTRQSDHAIGMGVGDLTMAQAKYHNLHIAVLSHSNSTFG